MERKSGLRITEAIAHHYSKTGEKLNMEILACKIWPDLTNRQSARVKLTRLNSGEADYVNMEVVNKICEITGVSPNYLFGYESNVK